jgi:hypothetical protein
MVQQRGVQTRPNVGLRQTQRPAHSRSQRRGPQRRTGLQPKPQISQARQPRHQIRQPHHRLPAHRFQRNTSAPSSAAQHRCCHAHRRSDPRPGRPGSCARGRATRPALTEPDFRMATQRHAASLRRTSTHPGEVRILCAQAGTLDRTGHPCESRGSARPRPLWSQDPWGGRAEGGPMTPCAQWVMTRTREGQLE